MTKKSLLIFEVAIICCLTSCKENIQSRDWESIQKDKTIEVAICYNELGYYHNEDSIAGEQYKMVKDLCSDFGIKPNFRIQNNLDSSINGLLTGKYDLIASLIPTTAQLKEKVNFTNTLCLDRQVLVQRKKDKKDTTEYFISSQLDLPGHCISIPKKSLYYTRLKNLEKELGDSLEIDEINNYQSEQLIVLVAEGDLDYTVCNKKTAQLMAKKYPQIDYSTDISFNQLQAWAVRKNSPVLLQKINDWLNKNADNYFK